MTAHDNGRANRGDAAALNVAIIQMNSQDDKQANIAAALDLIDRATETRARLVALPEVWPYLGPDDANRDQAETIPSPITELLAQRARRHGIYIHGGSIYETRSSDPRMFNTTVVIDPTGEIIARYSKIHMFDVVLDGVAEYQESATVTPGVERRASDHAAGSIYPYDWQGSLGDVDPRPRHRERAVHDRPRAVGHAPAEQLVLWTVDGG